MHAKQLAQIATSLASMGWVMERPEIQPESGSAHSYWLANRFRCDAWHQRISSHRTAIERCGTSRRTRLWHEVLPTLEEILISEPLTRVIAYLAQMLEANGRDADWSALAHSTLANHIEARHRCLNLMVFGYGFPVERAVGLNRLRRILEFFNDQLISSLPARPKLDHYVFDASIVMHQQKQFRSYPATEPISRIRLQSLLATLEQTLINDHRDAAAHPRLNQSIAEAVLAFLPANAFDSFGIAQSRLDSLFKHVADDVHPATDDYQQPLQAPLDLITPKRRIPEPKSRRRL